MRALKFVPWAAVADHLRVGWVIKYPGTRQAHRKATWLVWEADGFPVHPELEKLFGTRLSQTASHSSGDGEGGD